MSNTLKRKKGKGNYGIAGEMRPDLPAFHRTRNSTGNEPARLKEDAGTEKKGLFDGSPLDHIQLTRFTYESWERCYPNCCEEACRESYEKYHKPHDFLGYVSDALTHAMGHRYPDGDLQVSTVLIDDHYFDWLGDRQDSSAMRSLYCKECGTDGEGRTVEAGLAVTEHLYGLRVVIPPVDERDAELPDDAVDMMFSAEAAKAIAHYAESVINGENFEVCCLPFLRVITKAGTEEMKALARECLEGADLEESCARFLSGKSSGGGADVFYVPLFVRETHPHATVTAWDAFSAFDKDIAMDGSTDGDYTAELVGRHLDMVSWDAEGLKKAGRPDVTPFANSIACRKFCSALSESGCLDSAPAAIHPEIAQLG